MDIIIRSDTHWRLNPPKRPAHIGLVLITAYQETDCWIVIGTFQQFINSIDIIIELPGILRLKWLDLQFYDNIRSESDVVEKHINSTGMIAYNKFFLSAYKRETSTKFKKKPCNILFESRLKLFFFIIDRNSYKPEVIVVFCDFLRHATLSLRQILLEIADSLTVRSIKIGFQRIIQCLTTPSTQYTFL